MRELLEQLLSIRDLSLDDPAVRFQFARALPAYAWALVVLASAGVAWWSYARLEGARGARIALAMVRAMVLVLLVVLIAGPELTRQNERVEKDWVVVMADRSASMAVADGGLDELDGGAGVGAGAGAGGGAGGAATRDAEVREAIRAAWPTLSALARERNVLFVGFDQRAFDLRVLKDTSGVAMGVDLGEATGRRTRIGQSLDQTLRRVAAKPVAGIVLLSDGRSADRPGRSTLRQLEARQIPVFAVPLGGRAALADFAIRRVDAPGAAFAGDMVPVTVEIDASGLGDAGWSGITGSAAGGAGDARGVRVRLVDDTGATLDERAVTPPTREGDPATVTLTTRPDDAGSRALTVVVESGSPDLSPDNNRASVQVDVADRPIRVIYMDGYPRWEHRYLKNLLLREPSVRSSNVLLAGDKRYIQEGTDLLASLPRTQQEWSEFDVIIIGDMRPELLSDDQLRQIREHVAQRGGGVMFLGGPGAMPMAWRGTALADLIPFTLAEEGSSQATWSVPTTLRRGAAAARLGVLQLGESPDDAFPPFLSDGSLAWTLFRWSQRIDATALKPTTEVLATMGVAGSADALGDGSLSDAATPVVMTMRFGAGRVVYVGTDEVWRLRYGRGETLPERFWLPLVRMLARESLGRGGTAATLEATPRRALVEQQVGLTLRLLDQSLLEAGPEAVTVRVRRVDRAGEGGAEVGGAGVGASDGVEVTLRPDAEAASDALVGRFVGVFVPADPGAYVVDSRDPTISGLGVEARFEVAFPDDEMRTPQTDHALLEELSTQTGGQVIAPSRLSTLVDVLPNREVTLVGTPDVETLWDTPLALMLFLMLVGVEWVGRRLIRLA